MHLTLVLWALILLSALLLLRRKANFTTSTPTAGNALFDPSRSTFEDIESCKAILACTLGGSSRRIPLLSQLQARALPNERLQVAFGIDNAFTTTDVEWYKEFRKLSESHLRVSNSQWKSLATTARQIATTGISSRSRSFALAPLVQTLTLKISLQLFFGLDASTLNNDTMSFIASSINTIWLASKQHSQHPAAITPWHHHHALIAALRALIPSRDPLSPRQNPMTLILPAYETTWRVVLRCLLEVRCSARNHRHSDQACWRAALAAFLHDPTPSAFHEVVDADADADADAERGAAVSAAAVAKEALRLYPPTRRVYRDLPLPAGRVAADVEGVQRDGAVWGGGGVDDARSFWPRRWVAAASGGGGPFLAFGGAPFLCPARAAFGPMMVAVLVAALVEALPEAEFEMDGMLAGEMANVGEPLSNEREAYGDLRVVRK
ncbi:cytochrome p450 [Diplodia corticola]|uniref:Cytochrome p450 n=1 Tax=Diplodia corticola TaxID=236234 RepID=A0A1J9QW33_9PEZI|nr:cytochrome p450 [Diplodia corticola]OJD32593.1 cytochrome p450 [Diplodia corticola]